MLLEGIVLKPNMLLSGYDCPVQAGVEEVAERTLACFRRVVPAAVPGIAFLSGGQSDDRAAAHLSAMNTIAGVPWELTFSYGRALVGAPLRVWSGDDSQGRRGTGRPPPPGSLQRRGTKGRVRGVDGARAHRVKPPAVDVCFTPRDIRPVEVAVVVDVLRATSTIVQALAVGYPRVVCCRSVATARELRAPGRVLAGESDCVRVPGLRAGQLPRGGGDRRASRRGARARDDERLARGRRGDACC